MTLTLVRYIGSHPESIAGGRMVEPGEDFKLDLDNAENQRLVDDGLVVVHDEAKTSKGGSK